MDTPFLDQRNPPSFVTPKMTAAASLLRCLAALTLALLTVSCSRQSTAAARGEGEALRIETTLFPLYDWCRIIGSEHAEVRLLLPPGVEPHTFEPRPSDIRRIANAHLFVYTGDAMEPWAHDLLRGIRSPSLQVIDASARIAHHRENDHAEEVDAHAELAALAAEYQPNKHAHDHGHDHDHDGVDPHIWLDPVRAQQIVDSLAEGMAMAAPEHADVFRANARAYKQELQSLHEEAAQTVADLEHRTILFAGHAAFGYFARRYGLEIVSSYRGFSPDAEPTPRAIADLHRLLQEHRQKVVYHEELVDPKIARSIASDTGAKLLLLHGAHNLTANELAEGATYLSIMRGNLERLRQGLGRP